MRKMSWEILNRDYLANLLLHVGFMAALIGVFFFTYGSYIEKTVTVNQIEGVVDGYFTSFNLVASPDQKATAAAMAAQLTPPDSSDADAEVAASNQSLLTKAAIVLSSLLIGSLILAFIVSRKTFFELVKENILIVIAVACTEFCFSTFIIAKYKAIDPNYVKLQVVQALQTV